MRSGTAINRIQSTVTTAAAMCYSLWSTSPIVQGILVYGLSTLTHITVIGKMNLSLAYPLIIGLTVIATTISDTTLFHERVELTSWIGIGLM